MRNPADYILTAGLLLSGFMLPLDAGPDTGLRPEIRTRLEESGTADLLLMSGGNVLSAVYAEAEYDAEDPDDRADAAKELKWAARRNLWKSLRKASNPKVFAEKVLRICAGKGGKREYFRGCSAAEAESLVLQLNVTEAQVLDSAVLEYSDRPGKSPRRRILHVTAIYNSGIPGVGK